MRPVPLLLAAVVATTVVAAPALAVDGPSVRGATNVVEREDHATATLRDPWDYSQQTDIPTDIDFITLGVSDAEIRDGLLDFSFDPDRNPGSDSRDYSYATLKMMAAPFNSNEAGDRDGALVDAWDGLRHPIDADRLTSVTMRVWSSQYVDRARFSWHTCHAFSESCQGGQPIVLREGWQTITLELGANGVIGYAKDWEGDVLNLRLEVSPDTTVEVMLDWLRVHEPIRDEIEVDVPGGGPLYWDLDRSSAATGDRDDRSSGRLPVADGVGRFPVEVFPPGTYHLWTEAGGYGDSITVRPLPRPFVDDPDIAGGVDYATERLGNPWDFADTGDVKRVCNATDVAWLDRTENVLGESVQGVLALTNGRFNCSSPPADRPNIINDPYLEMPLAKGGLDPIHYHRVTIDTWFDRPFDLADDSGGGAHGRFIWRTPNSSGNVRDGDYYADGREMVVFTNRTRYSYDMTDERWGKTTEAKDDRWGDGAPITSLRYDPNEDTSARRSFVDELRIAADDAASPTFDITFHDEIAPGGSTYTLGLDSDRSGYDGEVLAEDRPLQPGPNVVRLDATDRLPQAFWVWLEVTTPQGDTTRVYADAVLQVDPRISGADRIATAVELSAQTFDAAPAAVVAQASEFPDALAAVQLAAALEGPLLLTDTNALDRRVVSELRRLGVRDIHVAGGTVAVSEDVERALAAIAPVTRHGGGTRYDTAALLAARSRQELGLGAPDEVVVALGSNFPDALAAGPYVTNARVPLLLVAGDGVPQATADAIAAYGPDRVTVVGGPAAIPDEVAEAVAAGRTLRRIAGDTRFATGQKLLDAAVSAGADRSRVLVATGRAFPDALGAGAALAANGGVLVLSEGDHVPSETQAVLSAGPRNLTSFRVLGGPNAISHAVVRHLRELARL